MRLALNGATIMTSAIDGDVDIAADCGYAGLEIWAAKLDGYATRGSLEGLAERMRARGIVPWCINSIEDITSRDRAGHAAMLDELQLRTAQARALGAQGIVVVPGRGGDVARSAAVNDAVAALRMMSDVAGDVVLAFEFLGKPGCLVPTLDMAIDIVTRADRANVGLVIDTFHFYAGGSSFDDLARVPVEKLLVVHLNGCEDLPREALTDAHRLYPGEGAIPIGRILRALRVAGYDGMASIEIFRPAYWAQDPRAVATTAFERARAVLAEAGCALVQGAS